MAEAKSFEEIIKERRKWYYSVNSVHCRYLNENVVFNRHGFRHTLWDGVLHYYSIRYTRHGYNDIDD